MRGWKTRDAWYSRAADDRPRTVYLNGKPYITESHDEFLARLGSRRFVTSWCKAAGISRTALYALPPELRPKRDGRYIVEEPTAWWRRVEGAM